MKSGKPVCHFSSVPRATRPQPCLCFSCPCLLTLWLLSVAPHGVGTKSFLTLLFWVPTGLGGGPNADPVSMEVLLGVFRPSHSCLCPQFPGQRWWHPKLVACDHASGLASGVYPCCRQSPPPEDSPSQASSQGSLLVLGKHALPLGPHNPPWL